MAVTLLASTVAVLSVTRANAEVPSCITVQQGDTAANISLYLTGSVEHRFQPWFQIVDGSRSRVVPKSDYSRIKPGWRVCVPSSRLPVRVSYSIPSPGAAAPTRPPRTLAEGIPAIAWMGVGVVAMLLIAAPARRYAIRRRAAVRVMRQFGERFVCEFERPLIEPGCRERPLDSRLRVIPRRKRLEIHLAPTGTRRYPNLRDHQQNVQYDAERVARLLKDDRFVGGQLGARGRWVVIGCDFRIHSEQKGTK